MAKRVYIIFIIWLSLLFSGLAWGTLHYYSGTMDSTFEMTQTYTIVVPNDGLTSLTFSSALPEEYSLPNTTQSITGLNVTYSGNPAVEDYTDVYDSHFKKLTWANPSQGTINVTISYTVSSGTDWNILVPDDVFPFDSSGLPSSVAQFLQPSDKVQSDNPIFIDLADTLTSGHTTQWEALAALNGWIMDNIDYGTNPYGYDALSTYTQGYGNCSNYAHIALALVRAAGIPARITHGFSLSKRYTLPTTGEPIYPNWGQGTHAWIEVYYPSMGWVPYDPQRDLHHVDTHRVLWGRGIDTTGLVGETTWTFDSVPSSFPLTYWSVNVNWIDDDIALSYIKSTGEIDNFSFSSAVPSIQDHTITASLGTGGSVLPAGNVGVGDGANQTFTISPSYGYQIQDVLVDGASQGSVTSYTFNNITEDHTLSVKFVYVGGPDSGSSSCFINTIRYKL